MAKTKQPAATRGHKELEAAVRPRMTVAELARRTGIARHRIRALVHPGDPAQPTVHEALQLQQALGIDVAAWAGQVEDEAGSPDSTGELAAQAGDGEDDPA